MKTRLFKNIRLAAATLLAAFAMDDASAQLASCQNYTGTLTPNGAIVVNATDINNNSSVPAGYSLAILNASGGMLSYSSSVTLTCNNLSFVNGMAQTNLTLTVLNPNGVAADTCGATVVVLDPNNMCNTSSGGYTFQDTVIMDASDCNTCDGNATFYLVDANGNIANAGPYTAYWSANGMTFTTTSSTGVFYLDSLCAGTYSVAVVDGTGWQYPAHTIVIGCSGGGTTPVANCLSSITVDLAANGYAVVTPQMIDAGSTGGTPYIISNSAGVWNGSIGFGCMDIGTQWVTLAVAGGSNTPNGTTSVAVCSTQVNITDTTNVCGGQNNSGVFIDSLLIAASDCNTCDGVYGFGALLDANGNYIPVTAIVWQDGVVGQARFDLCPFMPYTFTAYDANQNAYTHTIVVGCTSNPAGGCIDPALIDTMAVCPAVYAPVCGCNGVTYSNDCEAQANGVTSWTTGVCNNSNNNPFYVTVSSQGTGCDTFSCTGYAMLTVSGANGSMPGPLSYQWSNGATGSVAQGLCAGVYTVVITEANTGLSQTVTVIIGTAQGCVWPGDTDDNTVVNNFDILPIALAYGESGPARANATLGWYGQSATDWNTANPMANMPNYKHIDANGDGLVDLNDTQAISLNYGQSYFRSSSSSTGTIPLFVESANANEGDRIGLPIMFGTSTDVAQDVYGLAFTIHYDPTKVVAGSIDIDFTGSWMGSDLLTFTKDFPALGLIEVAVARKDRQNISNFGRLGTLNLTISDDILRSSTTETMPIEITTVRVVDNANRQQGADVQNAGVVTISLISGVEDLDGDFQLSVFPNPTNDVLNVQTSGTWIEDITLMTTMGQVLVQKMNVSAEQANLNVADLPAGIYLLSVKTDKGIRHERVTVAR